MEKVRADGRTESTVSGGRLRSALTRSSDVACMRNDNSPAFIHALVLEASHHLDDRVRTLCLTWKCKHCCVTRLAGCQPYFRSSPSALSPLCVDPEAVVGF